MEDSFGEIFLSGMGGECDLNPRIALIGKCKKVGRWGVDMKSKDQAWRIYEFCIKSDEPVTYRDVLAHLGYRNTVGGRAIRYGLELVRIACARASLPVLTAIVVNQSTGIPSDGGLPDGETDWQNVKDEVFRHKNWPSSNDIDWDFVWENRQELSARYGLKAYWTNK